MSESKTSTAIPEIGIPLYLFSYYGRLQTIGSVSSKEVVIEGSTNATPIYQPQYDPLFVYFRETFSQKAFKISYHKFTLCNFHIRVFLFCFTIFKPWLTIYMLIVSNNPYEGSEKLYYCSPCGVRYDHQIFYGF